MLDRQELVTAALLGTDRRPLPAELGVPEDTDPAGVLLGWAARSSAAQRAGVALARLSPGPTGPAQTLPVAPPAARELVDQLLLRPQPELVNAWLRAAVRHGYALPPQHWASIVALAARNVDVDRPLLGAVLGARGRWFVAQNPQWLRLVPALAAAPVMPPADPGPGVDDVARYAEPEAILAAPQPWSVGLTRAALAVIGSWALGRRTLGYARAVGVRLPVEHSYLVQAAAEDHSLQRRADTGQIFGREAFAALDDALRIAQEIDRAFSLSPSIQNEPRPDPPQPVDDLQEST